MIKARDGKRNSSIMEKPIIFWGEGEGKKGTKADKSSSKRRERKGEIFLLFCFI